MPAVLDDVMRCDNDRNLHLDRIVNCRAQIDVLAQNNDRFYGRPLVGDLIDVSRDPHTTGAVDHLLLYDTG
jgi:hypothetical protein